jgi:hypothetical protein
VLALGGRVRVGALGNKLGSGQVVDSQPSLCSKEQSIPKAVGRLVVVWIDSVWRGAQTRGG